MPIDNYWGNQSYWWEPSGRYSSEQFTQVYAYGTPNTYSQHYGITPAFRLDDTVPTSYDTLAPMDVRSIGECTYDPETGKVYVTTQNNGSLERTELTVDIPHDFCVRDAEVVDTLNGTELHFHLNDGTKQEAEKEEKEAFKNAKPIEELFGLNKS